MQDLRRGDAPGQLAVDVHILAVHGGLNGHLGAAGLRAFVDTACGGDVRVFIDNARRQVLATCINAFVGGQIGAEDRGLVQRLPDRQNFAVVNDDIRLFEFAGCFACPHRRPFEPHRALSRPFDIAVGHKRIHDLALHGVGLSLVRRGLFLGLALANGTPFNPRPIGTLPAAFPNTAVHPNVARQAPPAIQTERIKLHSEAHRTPIRCEVHLVIGRVDDHFGFRLGQFAGDLQRQHAIGHGQVVGAANVYLMPVDVRVLLSLHPVFEQLRVGVENRPVGDQYVGLKTFRNPAHAVGCPNQFGGNLGQGGKGGHFRQSVAHARPHGASDARWAFESVRRQREFDARSMNPGGIGRRQFPVFQFIQPHEAAGVGVADIVRFGVIQGKHEWSSRCLEFIQALVCVVSGDQNERVVHVLTHLRGA